MYALLFIIFKVIHAQLGLFELKSKNYSVHLNAILSIRKKNQRQPNVSHFFFAVNLMPNKIICFSNFYK